MMLQIYSNEPYINYFADTTLVYPSWFIIKSYFMSPQSSASERLNSLDVLRGVAVLLVLGRHIIEVPSSLFQPFQWFFSLWHQIGWIGVDLFFVLSGYLVSSLVFHEYLRTGGFRLGLFLIRRGLKIYPMFYLLLGVSVITSLCLHLPITFVWTRFLGELLFLQNYLGALWNHTWSLAVEEHFYLLLSLGIALSSYVSSRWTFTTGIPAACIGIIIAIPICRIFEAFMHPPGVWTSTLPFTHYRIDSLLWGVLLAWAVHIKQLDLHLLRKTYILGLMALVVTAFILPTVFTLTSSRILYSIGFSMLSAGFSALMIVALTEPNSQSKSTSWLSMLGHNSYGIYLWHMMVYWLSVFMFPPHDGLAPFLLGTALYLSGSIVLGRFLTRTVEQPVLRWRNFRWPSK
jgi:peptidoglycan/LPS O-acetylase OafA/YrhL